MQQQQILQRRDAFALRGLLREALEAPHLVAKLRQLFEVGFAQPLMPYFHGIPVSASKTINIS